jgi:hypothetical protein
LRTSRGDEADVTGTWSVGARRTAIGAIAATCATLAFAPSAPAETATFSNPGAIGIPAAGNSSPYPSSIFVSGMSGVVSEVAVTFGNYSHGNPDDVHTALVAPGGAAMLVFSCIGDFNPVSNVTFTVSDSGTSQLPASAWGPGTYRPTARNACMNPSPPSFPPPGPGASAANPGPAFGGSATLNGTFSGADPNGAWNLFLRDQFGPSGSGSVGSGWSLTLTTVPGPPVSDTLAPQAQITKGPKDKTKKKQATFEFTGTDARAIASFQCKLDAGAFAPCTSPHNVKVKKGKHSFQVQAVDQAGNVGVPATDDWKVKKKRGKRK